MTTLMDEYAVRVFLLAEFGLKADAQKQLDLIQAFSAPNMKREEFRSMIKRLERRTTDLVEDIILNGEAESPDNIENIKHLL